MSSSKKPGCQEDEPAVATVTEESRIVIRPGGEVVIEHLSEKLAEVALELNPDSDSLQCRIDSARPWQEEKEERNGDDPSGEGQAA